MARKKTLTDEQVLAFRADVANRGQRTIKSVADQHGIGYSTARHIASGKAYTHVKPPTKHTNIRLHYQRAVNAGRLVAHLLCWYTHRAAVKRQSDAVKAAEAWPTFHIKREDLDAHLQWLEDLPRRMEAA